MSSKRYPAILTIAFVLLAGGTAFTAQDKYTLRIPDGLSFSEFKGYESWQVVAVSHPAGTGTDMGANEVLNIIVANPVMIEAYAAGIPGNGKPFPDGSKAAKIQYVPRKSAEAPFEVSIPDKLKDVAFMLKDSQRFSDGGGWGYGVFNYDVATDMFTPDGTGAKCGVACHTIVQKKDYVFTAYQKR